MVSDVMDQSVCLPELLLPAGGFDAGLAAFEGGADAVYLGFSSFSARAQARNFGLGEYRRLLAHARKLRRKVYVAMNILVYDEELKAAAELASFLAHFPPDAVIIQDWGLARMLRQDYPGLALHASTQTAIQTREAALLARDLGISRVVLPRETGLAGIRDFVNRTPGMEIEVFVHGALCYSYSGLCHASGVLLGRSGNRGQCAQICRSWFDRRSAALNAAKPGYWFSCKDLDLYENIGELIQAGVSSLKVEGRMKSPEYCHSVARMYRAALDSYGKPAPVTPFFAGATDRPQLLNDAPIRDARKNEAKLTFSRAPTEGYFRSGSGISLVDPAFPGHRGLPVGVVKACRKSDAPDAREPGQGFVLEIEISGILGLRDGVMVFTKPVPSEPERFSVLSIQDARTGRSLSKAHPGNRILIPSPIAVPVGIEMSRISARYLDRKEHAPEEFPALVMDIGMEISVSEGRLFARLEIPACTGLENDTFSATIGGGESLPFGIATSPVGFLRALSVFSESGMEEFRFIPRLGTSPATGEGLPSEGVPAAGLFLPPSRLKAVKKTLYGECADLLDTCRSQYALAAIGHISPASGNPVSACAALMCAGLPPRASLVFPHADLPRGMPYATPCILLSGIPLPESGGLSWLPLAPLVRDFSAYAVLVESRLKAETAAGRKVMVGLSAFHHVVFARHIAVIFPESEAWSSPGFFGDVTLNVANRSGLASFREMIREDFFAYPPAELSQDYVPPLFHSAGCLMKHSSPDGGCPDDCSRSFTIDYSGNTGRFRAIIEDCISTVFLLP